MVRIVAPIAVLAAVLAASPVVAATAEKDASTLVLRKSDFGGRVTYEADEGGMDDALKQRLRAAGLSGNGANYLGATFDGTKGFLQVTGNIVVTKNAAQSRKAFGIVTKYQDALRRRLGATPAALPASSLPALGDQQTVRYFPAGNEGIGQILLVVRKNTVVWLLEVKVERRPKIPTRAELVGNARRFGLLQKSRVGAG